MAANRIMRSELLTKARRYLALASLLGVALLSCATGIAIQVIDLHSIYSGAPATTSNVRAMRESFDGPPDFQVRETRDYVARPLPGGPYEQMFDTATRSVTAQTQLRAFRYAELRMQGDRPVAQFGVGAGHVTLDARTGAQIGRTTQDRIDDVPPRSERNDIKYLHRMTSFGTAGLVVNLALAVSVIVVVSTGLILLFRGRLPVCSGGGTGQSAAAQILWGASACLVLAVSASGLWLAVESAGLAIHFMRYPPGAAEPVAQRALRDAEIAPMLQATLAATDGALLTGEVPKVIRLRHYAGYPQGIVVTGGTTSRQLVFDTRTGQPLSQSEKGYPPVPFPFGWEAHQLAKKVHRGDIFGLPGRWLNLLSALALLHLCASAAWSYLHRRRSAP